MAISVKRDYKKKSTGGTGALFMGWWDSGGLSAFRCPLTAEQEGFRRLWRPGSIGHVLTH